MRTLLLHYIAPHAHLLAQGARASSLNGMSASFLLETIIVVNVRIQTFAGAASGVDGSALKHLHGLMTLGFEDATSGFGFRYAGYLPFGSLAH